MLRQPKAFVKENSLATGQVVGFHEQAGQSLMDDLQENSKWLHKNVKLANG